MAGKKAIRQKVASFLELPGDVMLDVARITLIGDTELLVENHRGICHYAPGRVILGVPQGRIAIAGDKLMIRSLSPDQMLLLGKIREISYQD